MSELQASIRRQPEVIEQIAGLDISSAVKRLRSARAIRLVGTGTSQHAAELGAFLMRSCGVQACSSSASELARWADPGPQEAWIVISHTGETSYAQRCRAAARDAQRPMVCITGPDSGWEDAIVTPVKETSETYTVSYLATLAVIARLAHSLANADTGPDALREVADDLRAVIADPQIDTVAMPARAQAIVGVGPWSITAREGALKIREAARMLCEGFDAERLLHGAAVPYGPADGLVVLEPEADPDGLLGALASVAARERIPVQVIGAVERRTPFLDQFAMTVRLQLLAARYADVRRTDPDVAIVGAWGEDSLWTLGAPETEKQRSLDPASR